MVWLGPGYFMSLFTYSFSLKLLVCLFNLGIPKAVRFWNLKPHLKHRTFCKTLRCFQRCCSIFNDAIFQQCLKKLQNIVQTMHLTMSIAHPCLWTYPKTFFRFRERIIWKLAEVQINVHIVNFVVKHLLKRDILQERQRKIE